jgi:hypothetical protein
VAVEPTRDNTVRVLPEFRAAEIEQDDLAVLQVQENPASSISLPWYDHDTVRAEAWEAISGEFSYRS